MFPIENVDADTLKGEIAVNVAKQALVMTEKLPSYHGVRDNPSSTARENMPALIRMV